MKYLLLSVLLGLLTGCGGQQVVSPSASDQTPEKPKADSFESWLGSERRTLAEKAIELRETLLAEQREARKPNISTHLVPELAIPISVPIWNEAIFQPQLGIAIPAYVDPEKKEDGLAWHLARFGDLEAALKIASPENADSLRKLHQEMYERNYPAEWTRLVALSLLVDAFRWQRGQLEFGAKLVEGHEEIARLLSPKVANSPLGAMLLPIGKRLTEQALPIVLKKDPKLAEQMELALAKWGDVPPPPISFPVGADRELLARIWGEPCQGRLVVPSNLGRVLDTLGVPLPPEGLQSVQALFDEHNKLGQLILTYQPRLSLKFPSVQDLAERWQGWKTLSTPSDYGKKQRTFVWDKGQCLLMLATESEQFGAIVQIRSQATQTAALPRDWKLISLDASFEENRLRIAPQQSGEQVVCQSASVLRGLPGLPLSDSLEQVTLTKAASGATASLSAQWKDSTPWGGPYRDLVQRLGPPAMRALPKEGTVALVWENDQTLYQWLIPNRANQPCQLRVQNKSATGESGTPVVRDVDQARRAERLASGKPWKVLPQQFPGNEAALGMTREDVLKHLPGARALGDGLAYTFDLASREQRNLVPRQLLIRFVSNRAHEMRLLGFESPSGAKTRLRTRLAGQYGAIPSVPSAWSKLVSPGAGEASKTIWQDDVTEMSVEEVGSTTQWTLHTRPLPNASQTTEIPWHFLARGPEEVALGRKVSELPPASTTGGPSVMAPAKNSPYDGVFVWVEQGQAVRIVGRLASSADTNRSKPGSALDQLASNWTATAGAWMIRDADNKSITGYRWWDDLTLFRIYQQEERGKLRLFVEWQSLQR